MSQTSKEILLKSVIQAILAYSMRVLKLPKGLLKELNRIMQSFWWGQREDTNKMHWISERKRGKQRMKVVLNSRILKTSTLLC